MTRREILSLALAIAAAGVTAFVAMFTSDQRNGSKIIIEDPVANTEIVIWIVGAIATPGVYTLPAGSRLDDAVQLAGGMTSSADVRSLNLAARLKDEDRIDIPFIKAAAAPNNGTPLAVAAQADHTLVQSDGRININTADSASLEKLPGIGPAIAGRIIEYRTANGPFERIEELAGVKGISTAMVESLRDQITVEP